VHTTMALRARARARGKPGPVTGPLLRGSSAVWAAPSLKLLPPKKSLARYAPDPAFARQRTRRAEPTPRPAQAAPTTGLSRRARGAPTAKGTLSEPEREGGGRQLRVASSAGALTASQVARALSDDAADYGFAVLSRDRAFWDH
jgi:hypothetical protein